MKTKTALKLAAILCVLPVLMCTMQSCGPKYVFMVIGDGMGINAVYGTELYNAALRGETAPAPLTFTSFPYRSFLSSYSLNSLVTDSSAAGSALATGSKIESGAMAMTPGGDSLLSLAVGASRAGYGSGVVTVVGVNHATPAAFYSNSPDRNDYKSILYQLADSPLDFAAGGEFISKKRYKMKSADWEKFFSDKGWTVCRGAKGLQTAAVSSKVLYIGREDSKKNFLPYAMENDGVGLPEMTDAAIKSLEKSHPGGFFLMVEGGNIDHAAHENDAVCTFNDINEMDRAVDVIMEFYRKHPRRTLVVVTADHETGGMNIGNGAYEAHFDVLTHQKVTKGYLTREFRRMREEGNPTWAEARQIIADGLGLWTYVPMTEEDEAALKDVFDRTVRGKEDASGESWYASNEKLARAAIDLLQAKAMVDFSVITHTGNQVPLYAIGCGADKVALSHDQTDVANIIRKIAKY